MNEVHGLQGTLFPSKVKETTSENRKGFFAGVAKWSNAPGSGPGRLVRSGVRISSPAFRAVLSS